MNSRLLLPLTVVLASLGCGAPGNTCDVTVCPSGCCDADGICQGGTTDTACGSSGLACQVCGPTNACLAQMCLLAGNTGGGVGGGAAGGSGGGAAGGTAGGGSAGGTAGGGTAGGGTAGGAGGGGPAQVAVTVVVSGAPGASVKWTFGSSQGTCPGNCQATASAGSTFKATAEHGEFAGFVGWSTNCGSDQISCTTSAVTANTTVRATFQAQAQSPQVASIKTFTASDTYGPTVAISSDADAGFLLAGKTTGTVNFGGGPVTGPGYLAAYDTQGVVRWAEHLPATRGSIEISDVAASAQGIVVGGRCTSGAQFLDAGTALPDGPCVARLDAAGAPVWAKGYAGAGSVSRVAISPTGAVAFAAWVSGAINFGTGALSARGASDFAFVLLDASGTTVMSRRGGNGYDDAPTGVAFAPNGEVLFSAKIYGGPAYFETLTMTQANFQTGSLLARYSAAGVFLSGRTLNGQALATDLLVSPTGDVFWVGEYSNTLDFGGVSKFAGAGLTSNTFVAKYNPALQAQWVADGYSQPGRAALAPDGSVELLASYYRYADWGAGWLLEYDPAMSGTSALLVKIDPSGAAAFSKRLASGAGHGLAIAGPNVWVQGFGQLLVGAGTPARTSFLVSFPR